MCKIDWNKNEIVLIYKETTPPHNPQRMLRDVQKLFEFR